MRSRLIGDQQERGAGVGSVPSRRVRVEEDNSQAAVLGELGLTLAGFLAVAVCGTLIAIALLG